MAKLYFRYGAMGSSKTANVLMVRYNYDEKGQNVLLLKPRTENRDGEKTIRSRIGLSMECQFVEDLEELMEENEKAVEEYAAIIVDEAQFLTRKQVDMLSDIVDYHKVPVLCYGLRTDFQTKLFEGSERLFELADVIEEVPTVCWCGKRAHMNTRVHDGKMVLDGAQVFLGGNESYVSLCRKHYKEGMIENPEKCSMEKENPETPGL